MLLFLVEWVDRLGGCAFPSGRDSIFHCQFVWHMRSMDQHVWSHFNLLQFSGSQWHEIHRCHTLPGRYGSRAATNERLDLPGPPSAHCYMSGNTKIELYPAGQKWPELEKKKGLLQYPRSHDTRLMRIKLISPVYRSFSQYFEPNQRTQQINWTKGKWRDSQQQYPS